MLQFSPNDQIGAFAAWGIPDSCQGLRHDDPSALGIALAPAAPPLIIEAIVPSDGSPLICVEGLQFEVQARVPSGAKPGQRVSCHELVHFFEKIVFLDIFRVFVCV